MNNGRHTIAKTNSNMTQADLLILVDSDDNELGHLEKELCHIGYGKLHRAFSIFLFNDDGDLLIQQRADCKPLWGNYWSNTCCSHPRVGESLEVATNRRTIEELGIESELHFIYKFEYQASFNDRLSENELCSVFCGHFDGSPIANPDEVKNWEWISPERLSRELKANPNLYTPWLKLEWRRLQNDYADHLQKYTP